ncbi:putative protein isoform X1 [Capsicum galapagoense]
MLIYQRNVLPILLVLYLLLSNDGVQGEMKLSKLEELSLEKQIKLLNKPAVKTIKAKWGDTYDCVDFSKQPAFDHPLLKNHNFHSEMKPTLSMKKQIPSNSTIDISGTWLETDGCPSGTVPIKRITKDDLIRQRRMPPSEDTNFIHEETGGFRRAIVKTPDNASNKFAGAGMVASLWNPSVEGAQNSACRLKIQKGQDSVQVGWRVDPTLYGDTKTRFFIHFQAGNKHCYNTLCPGFVVTNNRLVLDTVFKDVAHRGANTNWELVMSIDRDANGNWWLLVDERMEVGFWPQKIFTALSNDFAENIEWGGSIYSPPGVPYPPMGSGFLPKTPDPFLDAYCRALTFSNDKGEKMNAKSTPIFLDSQVLYHVIDKPDWEYVKGAHQHIMFYGGPNED